MKTIIYRNEKFIAIFFTFILLFSSCTNSDFFDSKNESLDSFSGEDIFKGLFFLNENFASQIEILENSILYNEINTNSDMQKSLDWASNIVINEINKHDPTFFEHFEQMVKSRNEYQISEAIDNGSKKLLEFYNLVLKENGITEKIFSEILASGDYENVVDKYGNLDSKKLNEYLSQVDETVDYSLAGSAQKQACLAAAVVTVAFFVAAGAVLVAGAIAIVGAISGGVVISLAAAIGVYIEIAAGKNSNTSNELGREVLISQIASI